MSSSFNSGLRVRIGSCCVGALLTIPTVAFAANGFYLTGYGNESTFMGGADVAVSRDAFAINNNPAGLTQIDGSLLDINATMFDASGGTHSDNFNNYRREQKTALGGYGNLGYAQHLDGTPFTVGSVFVIQFGLGWTYKNVNTAF